MERVDANHIASAMRYEGIEGAVKNLQFHKDGSISFMYESTDSQSYGFHVDNEGLVFLENEQLGSVEDHKTLKQGIRHFIS